jgi:VIT1/CCC1 family predicted Fe2+/Mn2+ transporter
LALIFEAKGIKKEDAKRTALALVSDPAKALDTLAREELGINPEELGSPWVAAFSSFTAFGLGALIPLIPFWLIHSHAAFYGSLCLSLIALFLMGGIISLFTGKSFFLGGLRMLGIGCLAGACTYGIGKLLGVSLS